MAPFALTSLTVVGDWNLVAKHTNYYGDAEEVAPDLPQQDSKNDGRQHKREGNGADCKWKEQYEELYRLTKDVISKRQRGFKTVKYQIPAKEGDCRHDKRLFGEFVKPTSMK